MGGDGRQEDSIIVNQKDNVEKTADSVEKAAGLEGKNNPDLEPQDGNTQVLLSNRDMESTWVCLKCGAVLDLDHEFCSKCGTPRIKKCANCGAVIKEGQDYCPKCGKKVSSAKDKIASVISDSNEHVKKNKKIFTIIGIVAAAVVVVIVLIIALKKPEVSKVILDEDIIDLIEGETASATYTFEPENAGAKTIEWESSDEKVATVDNDGTVKAIGSGSCNITIFADKKKDSLKVTVKSEIENYLETGNFEKAYECADNDEERLSVIAENIAAVQSAFSADNLKDPSSFVLREAYYDNDADDLVLSISGNNSYGASVSSYWLYTWNEESKEWEYFCSVSDLVEEEYKSYDDDDDKLEKLINNIGRDIIKTTMSDGYELSKAAISRINRMFEEDTLDTVKLLDVDSEVV